MNKLYTYNLVYTYQYVDGRIVSVASVNEIIQWHTSFEVFEELKTSNTVNSQTYYKRLVSL